MFPTNGDIVVGKVRTALGAIGVGGARRCSKRPNFSAILHACAFRRNCCLDGSIVVDIRSNDR
jgi:hypothetical protein